MKENESLYQITQDLSRFEEVLEMEQGEFNEDLENNLIELHASLEKKTDGVVGYIQKQEDYIKLANERIKQLQEFKKSKQNMIERFKDYVKQCLELTDKQKFVGKLNTIKLRKPSKIVNITDKDKIPADYLISEHVVTVDKTKLKADLKDNGEIDGAELIDGKTSISIGLSKGK